MNYTNLDKAIRSKFRLQWLKANKGPDIVIENEERIWAERSAELSKNEMKFIETNWVKIYNKQLEDMEKSSEKIVGAINEDMKKYN